MINHSEQINELAAALSKAQGTMKPAEKDSNNPFFKSSYADLASVTRAIAGPFSSNGLSYIQSAFSHDGMVGIETTIIHSSGQWAATGVVWVPVNKKDAQGYGSAITYARRYSLQMAAGLSADDDDGNAASRVKPDNRPKDQDTTLPRAFLDKVHSAKVPSEFDALIQDAQALGKPLSTIAWNVLKDAANDIGIFYIKSDKKFSYPAEEVL